MKARTASWMEAPTWARGVTNLGVNQGKKPMRSWVTRTWPSQCFPEPMPMVGIFRVAVICWETSA